MDFLAAAGVQVTADDWWKICIVLGGLLGTIYVGIKWGLSIQKYWVRAEDYEREQAALRTKLASTEAQVEKLSKRIDDMGQAILQSSLMAHHDKSTHDRRRRDRQSTD